MPGYNVEPEADPASIGGRPVQADVQPFLDLDPALIQEQFDTLDTPRVKIGSDYVSELIGVMHSTVNNDWTGEAAAGFQRQVTNVKDFVDSQGGFIEEAQLGLLAAYKLAVLARRDFVAFGNAMLDRFREYEDQRSADSAEVLFAVLGGVVGGVLSVPTGGLFTVGVAATAGLVGGAVSSIPKMVGGDSLEELAQSYRDAYTSLTTSLEDEINMTARANSELREKILSEQPMLFRPLPPKHTDVHSPEFRYEYFQSDHRAPEPGFVAGIGQQQTAEPAGAQDSPIRRALG